MNPVAFRATLVTVTSLPMKAFSLLLVLASIVTYAQQIPKNPNSKDAQGRRQGTWTIWLNKDFAATTKKDSTSYYRIITYKDGKPDGMVRDYFFKSGKVNWEGYLLTDDPEDIMDLTKPAREYSETGQLTFESGGFQPPSHPNVTDDKGQRQGLWTFKIGPAQGQLASKDEDVAYYRIAEFKDDVPFGLVKDYFTSGTLYQELTLRSMNIGKTQYADRVDYTQPYHIYWPDGSENLIAPNRFQSDYYFSQGKLEPALEFAEKALVATEKKLGKKDLRYQYFLNRIAIMHQRLGNYVKAEAFFLEAINFGPGWTTAQSMLSLANVYLWMGNSRKAEELSAAGLELVRKQKGTQGTAYATALNDIGNIYLVSEPKKAEAAYLESLEIENKAVGNKVARNSITLMNLSRAYSAQNKYLIATTTMNEVLDIEQKRAGKENQLYAQVLGRLASIHKIQGKSDAAEKMYLESLDLLEKANSKNTKYYTENCIGLGELYIMRRQYDQAEFYFKTAEQSYLARIENFFPKLSEFEKESYYKSVSEDLKKINSFSVIRRESNPKILGALYDNQLTTKALLLNSSAKWKQRVRSSGDKKLFAMYTEWENNHALLGRWYSEDSQPRTRIDSLEELANKQEKELSARSEMFSRMSEKKNVSWRELKAKLKPNEVAIEMIRINKFGILRTVTDSSDTNLPRYTTYGLSDTVNYAALVLTNKSEIPDLILFENGNDLESRHLKYYSNCIKTQINDVQSYTEFWKPISDKLKKLYKKKSLNDLQIFFSADGVFNQININTLFNPATKKYVLDEVNISYVTNTKDILIASRDEGYNNLAYLVGYPDYGISADDRARLTKERSAEPVYYSLTLERGSGGLTELPGTKTEVETIAGLIATKGWQTELLLSDQALEETLKDCFKPRVMHIATHGFFQPDTKTGQNPLLRSGLMLAGASQTLSGNRVEKTEDGILTAYEAMNLNLDNTDLVVLSACETGLGEITNGQGVYGLQRAFKVAGARTIIMSLWNVNDQATLELMTAFYNNWLKGETKRDAFLHAQQTLKVKYSSPYFWGAFVLIGE